jgi:hypothetical protein
MEKGNQRKTGTEGGRSLNWLNLFHGQIINHEVAFDLEKLRDSQILNIRQEKRYVQHTDNR